MSLIHNKAAYRIALNTSSTNVFTSGYAQVAAATTIGVTYQSGKIQYYNGTGQILKLAYGAAGLEQDWLQIPPTNNPVVIDILFPNPNRLSIRAVNASATSGYVTLDFFI